MGKAQQSNALRDVELLFNAGTATGWTDRQLLEQFLDRSGESRDLAFAALVERHGVMVHRVCRSVLRDDQAADDAFQATFLILVRRGHSVWVRDSIGPWLYQVAHRVASCARSMEARRKHHEKKAAELAHPVVEPPTSDDLGSAIHQEIARLPERYRAPIVLCCLEGLTQQQAAGQLGWRMGTLQSRLARGRERLQRRLIRRGLAPSIAVSMALSSAAGARGAVSSALLAGTIDAAMAFATVKADGTAVASVSTLAHGVMRTMFLHELKTVSIAIVAVVVAAAGVGVWARQESTDGPTPSPTQTTHLEEPIAAEETERPAPADGGDGPDASAPSDEAGSLKYGDGAADGKKSIGGSGELIQFSGAGKSVKVAGVRIHGSRYGQAQPPRESFLIYFLTDDLKRILHTEMAPYSLMERGEERWVDVSFEHPVELPKTFWVALDFRATQTKGVYLSFDSSTGGKHSRVGLPGMRTTDVNFGGDWMVEAVLAK
jgi:RNA polymerase sigma factor (sigma-70 family)